MMQNGEWLMCLDNVQFTSRDSSARLSGRVLRRVVDRERKTGTIIGDVPGLSLV